MQTRTRNALTLAVAAVVLGAGLIAVARHTRPLELASHPLDAVPAGALLVAEADLDALRGAPDFAPLLREDRVIPGVGKVREVCGFDPMDTLHEVALAIPAAGDAGELGLVAAGQIDDQAILACAAKVIEARGGQPVITPIGGFRTVRDGGMPGAGEIAVRKGGPLLLGAGAYLRAMIDAADGRAPTIRSSVAHSELGRQIDGGAIRVTVVLSPELRRSLLDELESDGAKGSPASSVVAGALGVKLGPRVGLHAVIACAEAEPCARFATALRATRDERAADYATRLVGFGSVLEQIAIEPAGELIHLRVEVPADQAAHLADRLLKLRGISHPMPKLEAPKLGDSSPDASKPDEARGSSSSHPPHVDEVLGGDGTPRRPGAPDAGASAPRK